MFTQTNSMLGNQINGTREYETPDDPSSIPLDVHLPSSLLPDLLPSSSTRQGPLYKRQPSSAASFINGGDNEFMRTNSSKIMNDSLCSGDRKINTRGHELYPTYSSSEPIKTYGKFQNGELDLDLQTKMTNVKPDSSSMTHKLYDGRSGASWNFMLSSFANDEECSTTMTYAAALRQSQQKLCDKELTGKSQFKF